MTPLFKKLNLKEQSEIIVANSPEEFKHELNAIAQTVEVKTDTDSISEVEYALCFVQQEAEVEAFISSIYSKLKGDALVWFAFPKKSSKKYTSEVTRDQGWSAMAKRNFEPVRSVAIDEDWSALRYRKVEYIKVMKRSKDFAMSPEGKKKTKGSTLLLVKKG